jgi:hypothetical protein
MSWTGRSGRTGRRCSDRDWSEPLTALRWHWGEAYVINCLGLGRWTAERRDTHETLRDQTPLGLRDKIIATLT